MPFYEALKLPLEAERFVVGLQAEMRKALHTLDAGLTRNPGVRINEKAQGWISVTPLTAPPEPANLTALKAEIAEVWPMTSLLDILKETDLRQSSTLGLIGKKRRECNALFAIMITAALALFCVAQKPTSRKHGRKFLERGRDGELGIRSG